MEVLIFSTWIQTDPYVCINASASGSLIITSGSSQKMEGSDGQVLKWQGLFGPWKAQSTVLLSSLARAGCLDGHAGIPIGAIDGLIRPEFKNPTEGGTDPTVFH